MAALALDFTQVYPALWRDLTKSDIIAVSTSAGKDSQVTLHRVVAMAKQQGVLDRVVAIHCDLGRAEWAGTRELAQQQCDLLGVPLVVCTREIGDLLEHVEKKGMWPGYSTRYCTSEHKRDQATKVITQLVAAHNRKTWGKARAPRKTAPVQVLLCLGLRAQESKMREAEPVSKRDDRASSSVREITRWLPVHDWTEEQIWAYIRETGMPYHRAYDLGMSRLSCVFCIYAPEEALALSGYHNRPLLDAYVQLEKRIGHDFQHEAPLALIQIKLDAGWEPDGKRVAWGDCGGGM